MIEISDSVKKLYNYNQTIKKIANNYYIINNVIIVSEEDSSLKKGSHFCILKNNKCTFNYKDFISYYDSKNIFQAFKENKKNIKNISIEKNKLFFTGIDDIKYNIGTILDKDSIQFNIKKLYQESKSILKLDINGNKSLLSEKDKDIILNNGMVLYNNGIYKFRLCKELIPNLKSTDEIHILFNKTNMPNIFKTIICVNKDDIISYHIYKSINY